MSLQAAFHKRLRKAVKPGTYPTKHGSITISPNPKKPKKLTYGGSLGEQERESPKYSAGKGMGVSGSRGVAKPGWASTKQPIPGGGSKQRPTPQVEPVPGMTPLGIKPSGGSKQGKNFKKIPADNPYAGGHRNVEAAVMKAVRAVDKHKDKRGSTEHHRRGGRVGGDGERPIKVGDWIKTDYGFRGQVVGEGMLGSRKNPIPAYKIDVGDGKITAVVKEDAHFMSESA